MSQEREQPEQRDESWLCPGCRGDRHGWKIVCKAVLQDHSGKADFDPVT